MGVPDAICEQYLWWVLLFFSSIPPTLKEEGDVVVMRWTLSVVADGSQSGQLYGLPLYPRRSDPVTLRPSCCSQRLGILLQTSMERHAEPLTYPN